MLTTSKINKHDLDESLVLPLANGGTGATDATTARTNLEITPENIGAATIRHFHNADELGVHTHSMIDITEGTLPVANGGTGATDAATARTNLEITPENIGAADITKHNVETYTSFEQLGLTNDNFAADNFDANINILNNVLPTYGQFVYRGTNDNFLLSVKAKLLADTGRNIADNSYVAIKLTKYGTRMTPSKLELTMDSSSVAIIWTTRIDGSTDASTSTNFIETYNPNGLSISNTATLYPITTLTNGEPYTDTTCFYWACGNLVILNMGLKKGIEVPSGDEDLTLFTLPSGFRPAQQVSVPVYTMASYDIKAEVNPSGNVNLNCFSGVTTTGFMAFQISFFIE